MKTKKKSGKNLRKSGKSQGKIRKFDGIIKVGILSRVSYFISPGEHVYFSRGYWKNSGFYTNELVCSENVISCSRDTNQSDFNNRLHCRVA